MPHVSLRVFARWRVLLLIVSVQVSALRAADSAPVGIPAPVLLSPSGAASANGNTPAALYPFLPVTTNNTGAGVLIVPAESFSDQSTDNAILPVAQWLNAHGMAGFVLRQNGSSGKDHAAPVNAVPRALQYLRAHAADFHLSATRIGVLGFGSGGSFAADAAFTSPTPANADAADPVDRASPHPDFLALVNGASLPAAPAAFPPPTFLVGSTNAQDNLNVMIDLWNYLRSPPLKVPVEAHFFPTAAAGADTAQGNLLAGAWPDLFYNWVRAYGFLTDQPRVAIKGSVWLDGRPLPFGYLILTPLDAVGAGPIVAHVFNSTGGVTIGTFSVPAKLGPVPGRYRVDVRQNANRWLSNSFSADLIRDPAFGHSRILSPSIDDQHSYTKAHPGDKDDILIDIKPEGNPDLKIEVFTK